MIITRRYGKHNNFNSNTHCGNMLDTAYRGNATHAKEKINLWKNRYLKYLKKTVW